MLIVYVYCVLVISSSCTTRCYVRHETLLHFGCMEPPRWNSCVWFVFVLMAAEWIDPPLLFVRDLPVESYLVMWETIGEFPFNSMNNKKQCEYFPINDIASSFLKLWSSRTVHRARIVQENFVLIFFDRWICLGQAARYTWNARVFSQQPSCSFALRVCSLHKCNVCLHLLLGDV